MIEAEQVEWAKECLQKLSDELTKIEKAKNKKINVFDASGMGTQEVKHSHFFAWLLDPKKPHGLGNKVLTAFVDSVISYKCNYDLVNSEQEITPNFKILAQHIDALKEFCADSEVNVEIEKVILSPDSRMDIYISSEKAKTILVVENKVFTSTHDDQLIRYENELVGFKGWHKIFVYLTPNGESPTNKGGEYNKNWCMLDYTAILNIVKELLKLPNTKENRKLKILAEDYIELVDDRILKGNKTLQELCKKIRREHKEAIDILLNYTENTEDVFKHCKEWVEKNIAGAEITSFGKRFDFYTPNNKQYFTKHGEDVTYDGKVLKCRYCFSISENITLGICLEKKANEEWSEAQKKIINKYADDKKVGDKYFSIFSVRLLDSEDKMLLIDEVRKTLDENLIIFDAKLKEFEEVLLKL